MKISVNVEEKLFGDAEVIFNETGLDFETSIRVMLKRIVRDGNFSFLFENSHVNIPAHDDEKPDLAVPIEKNYAPVKMTKSRAIAIFKNAGIPINGVVTFSSKNKGSNNYWANPLFSVLDNDWFLILNDWMRQDIYLFMIPAKTFEHNRLVSRADKELIDLQIVYGDSLFTDIRSKISFAEYFKTKIHY